MQSSIRRAMQVPISSLPLPPVSHLITHNLTPDPLSPSPSTFRAKVQNEKPSIQRRARLLASESHFSYVSPLPLPFPYEITAPEPPEVVVDKAAYVEKWLIAREATHPSGEGSVLRKYYSKNRDQARELIGLAGTGLKDCLPHLDVGDAFERLGKPALLPSEKDATSASNLAREELVDVLSGHAVLMSPDDAQVGFAPWSLRYSGHQFGSWAGQLGDGRAISVCKPHTSTLRRIKLIQDSQW